MKNFPHYSKFKFNKRVVKIEYSNRDLSNLIDPKFTHLKCDDNEQIVFKVQEKNKRISYLSKINLLEAGVSQKCMNFREKYQWN